MSPASDDPRVRERLRERGNLDHVDDGDPVRVDYQSLDREPRHFQGRVIDVEGAYDPHRAVGWIKVDADGKRYRVNGTTVDHQRPGTGIWYAEGNSADVEVLDETEDR